VPLPALPALTVALLLAPAAGSPAGAVVDSPVGGGYETLLASQDGIQAGGQDAFWAGLGATDDVHAVPGGATHADARLGIPKAPLNASADATDEGLFLVVEDRLGRQGAGLHWDCAPDQDSRCDTLVDCTPGTWDCWATRQQREGWQCRVGEDGLMYCQP